MITVKVWCLPANETEEQLRELHKSIVRAMQDLPPLEIVDENDMLVLFVPDMMKYGLGNEILVEVEFPPTMEWAERAKIFEPTWLAGHVNDFVSPLHPNATHIVRVDMPGGRRGFCKSVPS